ncbi:MAG TPA: XRE family transcriptional regulator [Burkholderiales bacterium]|nr:XRE family transcriptional regulator [Burkholderiales bacterium]
MNQEEQSSILAESEPAGLEQYIGRTIRDLRLKNRLTIADVAAKACISRGMLSKIENGQTSTSLDTLNRLCQAFGITLSRLFKQYNIPAGGAQHVRKGEGMEVVRAGTRMGHTYRLLAYDLGPKKVFEPFLISMDDQSEVFGTFEHPGTEFIYMLEGKIEYRHGQHTYVLTPGDSLMFDGNIVHGPEQLIDVPIRFLALIIYGEDYDGSLSSE